MGAGRNWSQEDKSYLEEHWGTMTVPTLCKNLNRSRNSIMIMVQRLGLCGFYESGNYITVQQLLLALGYGGFHTYQLKSWVENRGFPVKYKRHTEKVVKVVYLKDFWEWAEKNQSFLDFSRFEENALGIEPLWAKEK